MQHRSGIDPMTKIFCDPVHGHISLHPACVSIIDTPEFQRLRYIKQTGLLENVYPGATHNRFCHSLGVCFLAGKFIRQLHERQPELGITKTDILCVEIAGLCHDLGHGPFSHTWELYLKKSSKYRDIKCEWKHERVSVNIFDYLIHKNALIPELNKFGIGMKEIQLIRNLIINDESEEGEKSFLYQIVNNEDSGLDVDKWDYFLRDCYYLGLPCDFDYERLMRFSCVLYIDGRNQICFRDKVLDSVNCVFRTRANLHKLAYQHKFVKLLEVMLCDALMEADGEITGLSGVKLQFWDWSMAAAFNTAECSSSMLDRFCSLTDAFVMTCFRECQSLKTVSTFIAALEKRSHSIYQHIAIKVIPMPVSEHEVLEGIAKFLASANNDVAKALTLQYKEQQLLGEISDLIPLTLSDIQVEIAYIHWGKRELNPVDFVNFYIKNTPYVVKDIGYEKLSVISPKMFQEIQVHIICKRCDDFAIQVCHTCIDRYWLSVLKKT